MKGNRFFVVLFLMLSCSSVHAAGSASGHIVQLGGNYAGVIRVKFAPEDVSGIVNCGSVFPGFTLNLNEEGGKALFSIALSAKAQGKPIRIGGRGVCQERSDTESVQWLIVDD